MKTPRNGRRKNIIAAMINPFLEERFYEKIGFRRRPHEYEGAGMEMEMVIDYAHSAVWHYLNLAWRWGVKLKGADAKVVQSAMSTSHRLFSSCRSPTSYQVLALV